MGLYLVTGAAGFIGAALAKRLLGEGHRVVSIDNLSTGFRDNVPEGVEFFEGDCGDAAVYEAVPQERYDAIFHIAGQSSGEISFDDPIYDIRTNAESTILLLKLALKLGCERFVYAGTMSAYGIKPEVPISESENCAPQSFYGVAKLASEHYMRIYEQYGIRSTSLRLFNVYGPGQNMDNLRQGMVSIFMSQMLNAGHIHVKGSGERFRDFIYIDDVVEAFVRCLSHPASEGKCINIGTGVRTSVATVVDEMVRQNGDPSVTVEYQGSTAGDIHGIFADTSLYRECLDVQEPVSFSDGLARMLTWAKSQTSAEV